MKTIFLSIAILISLVSFAYALDENTYVSLTADTIIAMHNYKSNIAGFNQWLNNMKARYPEFMGSQWRSFEASITNNVSEKNRVYGKILTAVKSKGYKAHISSFGSGSTAIEIID